VSMYGGGAPEAIYSFEAIIYCAGVSLLKSIENKSHAMVLKMCVVQPSFCSIYCCREGPWISFEICKRSFDVTFYWLITMEICCSGKWRAS
jgi:hypothetical protein